MRFLLERAPWLISSTTRDGDLPLHLACIAGNSLSVIQFLYNPRPHAIYARNSTGRTPLAEAQASNRYNDDEREAVMTFFQYQYDVLDEARNVLTPDRRGQLTVHRAIQNQEISLGTITLLLSTNAESLSHADSIRLMEISLSTLLAPEESVTL